MSEMNFEELQVIAGFLQTVQGQGLQVLVELATTRGLPAAVRLNAALALTGMYDQFALDVAEMFEPDTGWQPDARYDQAQLGPEPYPERFSDGEFVDEGEDFDVQAFAAEESARQVDASRVQFSEEDLAQMQALGLDPGDVMQPATEENLKAVTEKLARQQVGAQMEERGDESLGGASGLGPRNPKASRRRRKHGRR